MKFKSLFSNFTKLLVADMSYPIVLVLMIIFELMFSLLISDSATTKYSVMILVNFFIAIFVAMDFLKKDSHQNKYLKQKINSYPSYVSTQMFFMLCLNLFTGIISAIFTGLFRYSPTGNAMMMLGLVTSAFIGTGIVFACRSLWTDHKYISTIALIILVLLALADNNNQVLTYINWVLPPIANLITTFHEQADPAILAPMIIRQIAYAAVLLIISGIFNKKSYSK